MLDFAREQEVGFIRQYRWRAIVQLTKERVNLIDFQTTDELLGSKGYKQTYKNQYR